MDPEVFVTADGSHSLRSDRFQAAYHSTHGAINESQHIFIEAGLQPLVADGFRTLRVLEMGFGTGLNAFLTWAETQRTPDLTVEYVSYEAFPISSAQAAGLNYPDLLTLPQDTFAQLHEQAFGIRHEYANGFTLTKHHGDFLTATPTNAFDIIYYDAFAPEQQPELWTVEAMRHCSRWLRPGGRLITYCAKGQFKRNLRAAGFRVVALPGPVGKREITRADLVNLA